MYYGKLGYPSTSRLLKAQYVIECNGFCQAIVLIRSQEIHLFWELNIEPYLYEHPVAGA